MAKARRWSTSSPDSASASERRLTAMTEYRIIYISIEDGEQRIGCSYGESGQQAVREFLAYSDDCDRIIGVRKAA